MNPDQIAGLIIIAAAFVLIYLGIRRDLSRREANAMLAATDTPPTEATRAVISARLGDAS